MKVEWFAHASFLIEGDGRRIITDPYTPGLMGFLPINETADMVIRSSSDDAGHCYAEMIPGNPIIATATEIDPQGEEIAGLTITPIPTQESLIHKTEPGDNAMYRFNLEGMAIAHFGDVGNQLTEAQLAALEGSDILFVPTGGPPTIDLDDLCDAIEILQPRMVVPMHYQLPGCKFKMLPVTDFTTRFSPDSVMWIDGSEIELTVGTLPAELRVMVLKPSTAAQ